MNKPEPTRPLEEGIDPSNEAIVLERLQTVEEDKKTTLSREEAKKRIFSQPVPR